MIYATDDAKPKWWKTRKIILNHHEFLDGWKFIEVFFFASFATGKIDMNVSGIKVDEAKVENVFIGKMENCGKNITNW